MEIDAEKEEKQAERDHESKENLKKHRNNLLVAQVRAAGYGAMQDINQNLQSDFQDVLQDIQQSAEYQETMSFNREKESNKNNLEGRKLDIQEKGIDQKREDSANKLRIAQENTSASEINAKKQQKKSNQKKK